MEGQLKLHLGPALSGLLHGADLTPKVLTILTQC